VYYPPAYFADNAEPLPVLILIAGQPGDPGDWFLGDRVQNVMNDFAAGHNGIAPVVVVPDALGSTLANPDCLDSSLGNVDTYLSKDVPDGIKKQLRVTQDTTTWVIGGFSYGGICSLQMVTNHPDVYRNFVDISGLEDATLDLGQRQQTIDKIFGGDEAKFKAINPKDIMAGKRFEDTAGWFIAGSEDNDTNPGQQKLNKIAQAAGMNTQFWESPGTGHDWTTAVNGITHTMPWMATQMGLTS
jgi:S-formylglutathione hydrolase FrmB